MPFFANLRALNFVQLVNFSLQKLKKKKKTQKNQDSEPLTVLKMQILHFYNPQNRFHVKSE